MIEKKRDKFRMTITLLDAVMSVVVLILSLQLIQVFAVFTEEALDIGDYNYSTVYGLATALFFVLAAEEGVRWYAARGGPKLESARHLIGVVLFLAGGVLLWVRRGDYLSVALAAGSYGVTLALGRVEAIRRDRRARNRATNIIALVLIALLLGTVFQLVALPIFLILISFFHIGRVAFSQIDFRRMEKIIRKTYAVEIIFGMLLLIVAFSAVLERTEPQMETYVDALWYCFALVTTIGFGDITATGPVGRILSVILGVYGIIVVSLITSVIVNFYNEVKDAPDDAPPPPPEGLPEKENEEEETP